jgi:group I intron endonuclease
MVSIYKITSPSGKVYIGSTSNLKDRIYRYKTNRVKSQIKISRSISKYGWNSHKFEVIFECNKDDRNFYENKFGIEYKVLSDKGLNCSIPKGDDVFSCMSEETKIKIGLAHKGKKISEEQKTQMKINLKNWSDKNGHSMLGSTPWNKGKDFLKGEKNPMYGVKRSEEWKLNHSNRMKLLTPKGKDHKKSIPIINYLNGSYYFNIKEASEILNINYSTLKDVLRKKNLNKYNLCYIEYIEKLKKEL